MAAICPTTEAALQAGLLPAQERRNGHFAKVAGRLEKSFRRPVRHVYDYAALIVPTAYGLYGGLLHMQSSAGVGRILESDTCSQNKHQRCGECWIQVSGL